MDSARWLGEVIYIGHRKANAESLAAEPKVKPTSQASASFLDESFEEDSVEVMPVSYSDDQETVPAKQKPPKKQDSKQKKPIFQQS